MNADASSPEPVDAIAPEDRARADFYALIARLFHGGPDAALLAALAGAGQIAGEGVNESLAESWSALVAAAAAANAEAVREEYESVFVGTGMAEITPYASHYLTETMKESVLVRLRDELAAMGLSRSRGAAEMEDHFCGLCEVMRHLVLLGSENAAVQKQKKFFIAYISSWYAVFCSTTLASPNTDFYKHVARFANAFLNVEREAFEIYQ